MIEKVVQVRKSAEEDPNPVAMLVQMASQYKSTVYLEYDSRKVNAKSIMGMMSLMILPGDSVKVIVDGEDEGKAAEQIESYLLGA